MNRKTSKTDLAVDNEGVCQVIATVNHEINNPLTTVIALINFAKTATKDIEEAQVLLARAIEECFRIRDVTHKLARIRRVETKPYLKDVLMLDLEKSIA